MNSRAQGMKEGKMIAMQAGLGLGLHAMQWWEQGSFGTEVPKDTL